MARGNMVDAGSGMACCLCGGSMIIHGGSSSCKLWVLSLSTKKLTEVTCTGSAPPSRRYHTLSHTGGGEGVTSKGKLLLFGGDPLRDEEEVDATGRPPYWELDLDTLAWEAVSTFGEPPAPRSRHAACTANASAAGGGEVLVIVGGAPVSGRGKVVTSELFTAHVLAISARVWVRVGCPLEAPHPRSWGLSACVWREEWVLLYGGEEHGGGANDGVSMWNLSSGEWLLRKGTASGGPPTRNLHAAGVTGDELVVMGGSSGGRVLHDVWAWSPIVDQWRSIRPPFNLAPFASLRPLMATCDGVVVVCSATTAAAQVFPISPASPPVPPPQLAVLSPPSGREAGPGQHPTVPRRVEHTIPSPQGAGPEVLRQQLSDLESHVAKLAGTPAPRTHHSAASPVEASFLYQPPPVPAPGAASVAEHKAVQAAVGAAASEVADLRAMTSEMAHFIAAAERRETAQRERIDGLERAIERLSVSWTHQIAELRAPPPPSAPPQDGTLAALVDGVSRLAEAVADLQEAERRRQQPPHASPAHERYPPAQAAPHRARASHLAALEAQLLSLDEEAAAETVQRLC
eukprot:Hpha_TRINITY_DN30305_c0_g1::TRINITY_DN30305_c0_g1_i1::g.147108::m.147108